MDTTLTAARLRELLTYHPDTGSFTRDGEPAGTISKSKGYVVISIDGRDYRAHRLAWLYMTGEWPAEQIDHKNRLRSDNRWSNLRPATQGQNQANRPARGSASGFRGVYWADHAGKWRAEIKIGKRKRVLGYFDDPELAGEFRDLVAQTLWGDFYLPSRPA